MWTIAGKLHDLNRTPEVEGPILDHIHFLRNANIMRWGFDTYNGNADPPRMRLTKYVGVAFAKEATLIAFKEPFLEIYTAS